MDILEVETVLFPSHYAYNNVIYTRRTPNNVCISSSQAQLAAVLRCYACFDASSHIADVAFTTASSIYNIVFLFCFSLQNISEKWWNPYFDMITELV